MVIGPGYHKPDCSKQSVIEQLEHWLTLIVGSETDESIRKSQKLAVFFEGRSHASRDKAQP